MCWPALLERCIPAKTAGSTFPGHSEDLILPLTLARLRRDREKNVEGQMLEHPALDYPAPKGQKGCTYNV